MISLTVLDQRELRLKQACRLRSLDLGTTPHFGAPSGDEYRGNEDIMLPFQQVSDARLATAGIC